MEFRLTTPLTDLEIRALSAGDDVLLSGMIYTARDAAHKRMVELLQTGEKPPFPYEGQVVFYAGPSPAAPGRVVGAIGPTTGGRMDPYTPALMASGLRCMIGKGVRGAAVVEAICRYGGVYFLAIGGAAALLSRCVTDARLVAFPELGAEAVRALTVVELPLIVGIDTHGHDIYRKDLLLTEMY